MLETRLPTISGLSRLWGSDWRLSTWWPSDSRDAMQRSLLRLLSVAHTERLDLVPLVTNLAEEHRGSYRRRLRRLARRLHDGTPLVDALEQTPDVLRDESVLAIRFASQIGTLGATYRELIDEHDLASHRIRANLRQTVCYAFVTLLITVLAISFLMVYIVPMLVYVHEDFDVPVHWTLGALIALSEFVVDFWPLMILGAVIVAWLVWSSPARRYFRRFLATRWLRGVAKTRSAQLLRLLSSAVEQGRPLPAALSTLARYHFDEHVRRKLMFARIESEHRSDIWNILSESRLITPEESTAFAAASSDQSRVWAMRRLADWKLDQVSRRSETMVALVRPIIVLAFAAIILLAGSSMIGFLSQMIHELA